ncbi:hypothetical protein SFA35_10220 [Pseudomonas sp. HR96]|uniref:hypothetical protein n=1 Tax=Pseudomonas sp. HR96 TaxID=1027966 RepID=UPI002A74835E|nr:hypothetical protein [Pseudomonas sp. HR96]WPP01690.1 hypothetical protein SFA35_10220 [Pseudomonas sp. HR96]
MIFFAIDRRGYDDYVRLAHPGAALWLAADVLSEQELQSLRSTGVPVSCFTYSLSAHESDAMQHAVQTIREHHPGETVWVGV